MKKELRLSYPEAVDTEMQKYYFLYGLQEQLRLVHNGQGAKFRNKKITKAEWDHFLDNWFDPRHELVVSEILRLRGLASNHSWNVDIDDVFVE